MSLIKAVRPVRPAEVPGAMLAERHQPLVHNWVRGWALPGAGVEFYRLSRRRPRRCFHFHKMA
jgi:hypothetical protein